MIHLITTVFLTFLIFIAIIMLKEINPRNLSSLFKTIMIILVTMIISAYYGMVINEEKIDALNNQIKELERCNESKKN